MEFRPLSIEGAWEVTPRLFPDPRGVFTEGFRADHLAKHIGHEMSVRQTNISVSSAGALRGIHYADVPPSQAKYVTATSGVFVDYVVDIRVGSPTFGRWEAVTLDALDRRAVYLSEGLGHAFCALEDGTTAMYLCTAAYNPAGPYMGAYQFLQATWNSAANHAGRAELVGVPPSTASQYDQDDMAWTLYLWQGSRPWGGLCDDAT